MATHKPGRPSGPGTSGRTIPVGNPGGGTPGARPRAAGARPASLEARIYAVYAGLPPAEKRMAAVLLEHQTDLPGFTARQLAAKAQVSDATAARLIRTLGYATFPDAKRQIRADLHWGSPQAALSGTVSAGAVAPRRTVEADLDNIRATFDRLPERLLHEVAQLIAGARRLWILGLRSGYGLGHHAAHYFTLLLDDVRVLPVGSSSLSHDLASVGPGDVLLVTAFRRRPRLLPAILREARAAGAATVLITDPSAAASAKAADHVLRCHCQSPSPFHSMVAAVTVINHLAWGVAAILGDAGVSRFRRIDRLVELLDDVSTPAHRPRPR